MRINREYESRDHLSQSEFREKATALKQALLLERPQPSGFDWIMRFKGLDLNLLVALDALMAERNVTAAARSVNLSQPAMSAAIARLRTYFDDELFTMRGRELVPTPRAEGLAAPIREALLHIQLSVISKDVFNPAESNRRFRITLSDFMAVVLFRKVVERLAREAPAICFEFLPVGGEPDQLLRRGEVDFLILPELFMSNAHPKAALFDDRLVCVGCQANAQLSRPLTFERYMSLGHVAVKLGCTRAPSIEDWSLHERGLKRRIEIVVQNFSMIPPVLLDTGRLATMPSRLVNHFDNTMPLRTVDLPLPFPTFTEAIQWPAFHNSDPASIWMREILLEEASHLPPLRETTRKPSPPA